MLAQAAALESAPGACRVSDHLDQPLDRTVLDLGRAGRRSVDARVRIREGGQEVTDRGTRQPTPGDIAEETSGGRHEAAGQNRLAILLEHSFEGLRGQRQRRARRRTGTFAVERGSIRVRR